MRRKQSYIFLVWLCIKLFLKEIKRGAKSFFRKNLEGRRLFQLKKGGEDFFSEKIRGAKTFFEYKKGGKNGAIVIWGYGDITGSLTGGRIKSYFSNMEVF